MRVELLLLMASCALSVYHLAKIIIFKLVFACLTKTRVSYFVAQMLNKTIYSHPNTNGFFVCVIGIDSRYNEGCTELAKYLFYGLYGRNQLNLEHVLEEFPEEMLDGELSQVLCTRF